MDEKAKKLKLLSILNIEDQEEAKKALFEILKDLGEETIEGEE